MHPILGRSDEVLASLASSRAINRINIGPSGQVQGQMGGLWGIHWFSIRSLALVHSKVAWARRASRYSLIGLVPGS